MQSGIAEGNALGVERDRSGCLVEQTWDEEAQERGNAKVAVWNLGVVRLRWVTERVYEWL